jgi:DNA replication ATP-dependent helicase Dna2
MNDHFLTIVERNFNPDSFSALEEATSQIIQIPCFHILDKTKEKLGLPFKINLLSQNPPIIIIEPDVLINITDISETFSSQLPSYIYQLLKKMEPKSANRFLTLGNMANLFLDALLHNPDLSFNELASYAYTQIPLDLAALEDIQPFKEDLKAHFNNLHHFVNHTFPQLAGAHKPIIEPSFYSRKFGLHGRLDLYLQTPDKDMIIELKSGNVRESHKVQVLLYQALIKSVFPDRHLGSSYILYSKQGNLQRIHFDQPLFEKALKIRNYILISEKALAKNNPLFFNYAQHPPVRDFGGNAMAALQQKYQAAGPVAQKYVEGFMGFIFREHFLERIGNPNDERNRGLAGLWLQSYLKKSEEFNLLAAIKVKENHSGENPPKIIFQKTSLTDPMANFRVGDTVLIYPWKPDSPHPFLQHQIFRGNLIENSPEEIHILLNNRQNQPNAFDLNIEWVVERDSSDRSARTNLKGLYAFLNAPKEKQQLYLGVDFPKKPNVASLNLPNHLEPEKRTVLTAMINATDYYLLWGPPGTGKTSLVIKEFVRYVSENTQENLLLLAYTNRAVDEICEALDGVCDFLKIGHLHNTHPHWQGNLLSQRAKNINKRDQLIEMIKNSRVFVGTLSSLADKPEIFELKTFDTILVDEASQVHEPLLLALITKGKRFILIGDHKQLPAVVLQSQQESTVTEEELINIGLTNYGNSMFERLYKSAVAQRIHWSYGQLRQQGRMHQDIMQLPNRFFYENSLEVLPGKNHQSNPIKPITEDPFGLTKSRLIFIPTPVDLENQHTKLNVHEANQVVHIINWLTQHSPLVEKPLTDQCIGVITPFRAQIACIKNELTAKGLDPNLISVDTVERYQGGARKIIIYSLCSNSPQHLEASISLSDEGIDRKLNVAITRAREQIILLGNQVLLYQHPTYAPIINSGLFTLRDL